MTGDVVVTLSFQGNNFFMAIVCGERGSAVSE